MNSAIVVFGGTGGIGASLARRLTRDGLTTVLVARNEQPLQELSKELGCHYHLCDVTSEQEVQNVLATIARDFQVSGVAVCIGSILLKPAHLTSLEEFTETWKVNVQTAFLVLKHSVPLMRANGGSILLFASAAAEIGLANHEAIAAAKGAVIGLTKSTAATYAGNQIRVNCIAPGLVRTQLSEKMTQNPASEKASLAFHPLNRLGEPEDIAGLAVWLLSEEGRWATGQVFTVDGGLSGLKVARPA